MFKVSEIGALLKYLLLKPATNSIATLDSKISKYLLSRGVHHISKINKMNAIAILLKEHKCENIHENLNEFPALPLEIQSLTSLCEDLIHPETNSQMYQVFHTLKHLKKCHFIWKIHSGQREFWRECILCLSGNQCHLSWQNHYVQLPAAAAQQLRWIQCQNLMADISPSSTIPVLLNPFILGPTPSLFFILSHPLPPVSLQYVARETDT